MPRREENGLGDMIASIVDEAINSQEFERLNNSIRRTIDEVFDELHIDNGGTERRSYGAGDWAVGGKGRSGNYSYSGDARQWSSGSRRVSEEARQAIRDAGGRLRYSSQQREQKPKKPELYTKNPSGQISGILATIFGGLLTGIFGFSVFATLMGVVILGGGSAGVFATVLLLPFLIGSIVLLRHGMMTSARIRRFQTYVRTLAGKTYISIAELAAAVGKSEAFVEADLRTMISKKYFPHGHVDAKGTTLMLDEETWQQYQAATEAYEQRSREEKAREETRLFEGIQSDDPELLAAIREGERYIEKIREANEAIPGEEISRKLYRLEEVMRKIFLVLQQKPDQLPKLRKLMNYYMPTTDKLVQTYRELDAQPLEGENISTAKREIEETLDTINDAYEKLLDSFYMEAVMDVKSDITVLQNLMAQEGLTNQPFEQKTGRTGAEGAAAQASGQTAGAGQTAASGGQAQTASASGQAAGQAAQQKYSK